MEGKRTFNSQCTKDEEGRLLQDNALIRERWVRWFRKLLNTKSPTLHPTIVGELKTWLPCRPPDDVPSRYEVEKAIRALANRKAVGLDGLPAELLKVADEGESDTLGKFQEVIVAVWRGGGVPQQWKYATIKALHKKNDRTECAIYRGISLVAEARQLTVQVIAGRLSDYCERKNIFRRNSVGLDPSARRLAMLFVGRPLQQLARKKGVPLYLCFIDLTKMYDSVDWTLLWAIRARFGVPPRILAIIRQLQDGMQARMRVDDGSARISRRGARSSARACARATAV